MNATPGVVRTPADAEKSNHSEDDCASLRPKGLVCQPAEVVQS